MGVSMRLLSVFVLVAVCFVCSSGSVASRSAAEQPDISSSGSKFLEICSDIDNQPNGDPIRIHNHAACLGWVDGFRDGFSVHDELLGVPEKDRMVCVPRGITTIQIVLKYIAENPDKAASGDSFHRLSSVSACVFRAKQRSRATTLRTSGVLPRHLGWISIGGEKRVRRTNHGLRSSFPHGCSD